MGGIWSLFAGAQREVRIIVIGLDAAGKTTFQNRVKLGECVPTQPTIGFTVETVEHAASGLKMTFWDVGGQARLRKIWEPYFKNCDAVIWVVDSADRARLAESLKELEHVLTHSDLASSTLLVYANKQDLPGAASPSDVQAALKLNELCRSRNFFMQGSSFTNNTGINEGLDWLSKNLPPARVESQ